MWEALKQFLSTGEVTWHPSVFHDSDFKSKRVQIYNYLFILIFFCHT